MYLLPALTAGLVRCIYIDRLDKLSEGIGRQLREGAVSLYPLNKLLDILCLLLLFTDSLLQTIDLSLEVFLFFGVVLLIMAKRSSSSFRQHCPHKCG